MDSFEGKDCGVKRKRAANFSAKDKGLLVDLVSRYAGVLECKKTDGSTLREKELAWGKVADEFNGQVDTARDWKVLKTLFENIKKMAKKASADEKVGRKKTGGGTCEVVVDEMTQKVLAVLGNRATPLFNPFDADADYNGNFALDCGSLNTLETVEEGAEGVLASLVNFPDHLLEDYSAPTAAAAAVTATATWVEVEEPQPSTSNVRDPRHWAGKRRPRPRVAEQRTVATNSIAALADRKRAYYDEKIEMERAEHKVRMQLLQMKKELCAKKLAKFGEE